ncbi:MAG: holo-ACP synthase [Alphaproteobacteria bacterium]
MINIGVDIVRIERFKQIILDQKKYGKILSEQEITMFESFSSVSRKMEFIAGRFAAKEAIFKALSKLDVKFTFPNVSIVNDINGSLNVIFSKSLPYQVSVSISHSEDNAVGMALVM